MYFAAVANIGWNRQLPPASERSADDQAIANFVDETHQFVFAHFQMLQGLDEAVLRQAGVLDTIVWVKGELVPHLRTSHTVAPIDRKPT
jgi:hypothetical protein